MNVAFDHVRRAAVGSDDAHYRLVELAVASEADQGQVQALVVHLGTAHAEADTTDVGHMARAGEEGDRH